MKEFEESKEMIKELYNDMESVAKMNPDLYIIPVEMYNAILKKMHHMEDRIKKQTASLMMHIRDKKQLRDTIKELRK